MSGESVAISMLYPIVKALARKGFDPEAFCRYASFDSALLKETDARIAGSELVRLTVAAAQFAQDEYFGLNQGQLTEFADMGILGYVMLHSATLADALNAYQRYNAILCSGFNLQWETDGDEVRIRIDLQSTGRLSRHCVEDMASSVYRLMGLLANKPVRLRYVDFAHREPSPDLRPYAAIFGCEPRFGMESNAFAFGKEVLEYPVLYADNRMLGMFEAIAREALAKLDVQGTITAQVCRWMQTCMPSHFPTLAQTAAHLGISDRTLQAKLKSEHTTFNELSTRVRKELAMGYLSREEYAVGDIAYLLHFSEPSVFQNAFKKWTGLTPGQYRVHARG